MKHQIPIAVGTFFSGLGQAGVMKILPAADCFWSYFLALISGGIKERKAKERFIRLWGRRYSACAVAFLV